MGRIVSYTSYDYKPVHIVPVIASFDSDGQIIPLYVRINHISYKIESHRIRGTYSNSIAFQCKITDGDSLKPLVLTFHREEGVWTIPQT